VVIFRGDLLGDNLFAVRDGEWGSVRNRDDPTYEVMELSVPGQRAEEVKKFYRTVASDGGSRVLLKARDK
jgi:hypothetical protein